MTKVVDHSALIEQRKPFEAYTRNHILLDNAYAVQLGSEEAWSGTKWLCSQVPQMSTWLGLVPQGLDYLALEIVYLSDEALSIAEPTFADGEIVGERFREWLNNNECSVFMQHRRDIVIPILQKCSGKIVSMASGSALVEIAALSGSQAQLVCIDKNPDALRRAKEFAFSANMPIETMNTDLLKLNVADLQPDVIYSIGFLGNYLTERQIIGILANWLPALKSGGKLITDFINLDAETEKCLTQIVGWPIARTEDVSGLRVYNPNQFAHMIEVACERLGITADIEIDDYQYGGVATVTVT
ncbi:MAG: class I SAM-dependent methyltransferase [Candidatus Saccharimonadales bacterium]